MNRQEDLKKKEDQSNFYSQRNSASNFYQTGATSRQASKEKISININKKYTSIKMDEKLSERSKRL